MHLCDQWDPWLCSYPSAFPSNQRCDVIRDTRLSCLRLMFYRTKVFLLTFLTVLWWQGKDEGFVPVWYLSLNWGVRPTSNHLMCAIPSGFPQLRHSNDKDERLSGSTLFGLEILSPELILISRYFSMLCKNMIFFLESYSFKDTLTKLYNRSKPPIHTCNQHYYIADPSNDCFGKNVSIKWVTFGFLCKRKVESLPQKQLLKCCQSWQLNACWTWQSFLWHSHQGAFVCHSQTVQG